MKPAPFDYVRPTSLEELFGTLTAGDVMLAGGQSLLPDLNERRRRPRRLVDLNAVAELEHCEAGQDRVLAGALTRHRDLAERGDVRASVPVLAEAARHVGHAAVRTRGTLGGSIANADPAAELPGVCVLLGAVARLRCGEATGERTVGVADLLQPGGLAEHEVITAVEIPALRSGEGWGFRELSRPGAYAFPLITVTATVMLDSGGAVAGLRAAVTGAAETPYELSRHEAAGLLGASPEDAWADAAASRLQAAARPVTDHYASAAYRRRMVRHLARQAVFDAVRRAVPGAAA
ncbi:MAG: FAD binding domain-containing protein [Actinobacteria bacterium]|nr:FAD binding domain-containing protein [Actinomycetota bacterium]